MDILSFGMNGYNLVFSHNQLRRYGGRHTYIRKVASGQRLKRYPFCLLE